VPAENTFTVDQWPRDAAGRVLRVDATTRAERAAVPGVESWAWERVASVLRNPATVAAELERQRAEGPDPVLEADLAAARRSLAKAERQQERLVTLYATGDEDFPLDIVRQQMAVIEREKAQWQATIADLEERLTEARSTLDQLYALTAYCERVAQNLETFTLEEKRLALEALQVRVTANGRDWQIDGAIPVEAEAGAAFATYS
jgi:hypothetical protein